MMIEKIDFVATDNRFSNKTILTSLLCIMHWTICYIDIYTAWVMKEQ